MLPEIEIKQFLEIECISGEAQLNPIVATYCDGMLMERYDFWDHPRTLVANDRIQFKLEGFTPDGRSK